MPNPGGLTRALNKADLRDALAGRKRLPRPPRMIYPESIERQYIRELVGLTKAMQNEVTTHLLPALPRILETAARNRPTVDGVRLDEYDFNNEVENLMDLIKSNYNRLYSEETIAALVARIGAAISRHNGRELGKVFRSVLGVDLFASEPWLAPVMRAFVKSNVDYIVTLPSRFFPAIQQKVYAAASQGISNRELKKDIQKTYGNSNYNAERIARDQVGKFNGQLNELRLIEAGLDRYKWRTVRDDRVRKTHQNLEGKEFYFNKQPPEGPPGSEIMCRCYAEPIFDDLFKFD